MTEDEEEEAIGKQLDDAERRGFNNGLRTAVTLLESYAAERFLAGKDDEATRLREKVKQLKALATPSKVR